MVPRALSSASRSPRLASVVVLAVFATVAGGLTSSFGQARAKQTTCPRTDRYLTTARSQVKITVLVSGGAHAALLCRYRGVNPNPARAGTLARLRTITSAAKVGQLQRRFDLLQSFAPQPYSCPTDDQSKILAIFEFDRGRTERVTTSLGGCRPVTNGHLTRTALVEPGVTLVRQLKTLTR